ncbi:hypothetical protein [Pseudomonas sp. NA-150]|uniref:hypothetical protein n=1 Tax=Pseudomonas sp. NA-150 TaxID=3367525 RepID=UPI0037C54B18
MDKTPFTGTHQERLEALRHRTLYAEDVPNDNALPRGLNPLEFDNSFGTEGKCIFTVAGHNPVYASSIAPMRSDPSKYYVSIYEGLRLEPKNGYAAIMQMDENGNVEGVPWEIKFHNDGYSMPMQTDERPDGRILVSGRQVSEVSPGLFEENYYLSQLTKDGSMDMSFGIGGIFAIGAYMKSRLGANQWSTRSCTLLPDGNIFLSGSAGFEDSPYHRAYLVRVKPDGTLDQDFYVPGNPDRGYIEFTHPERRISLVGCTYSEKNNTFFTYGTTGYMPTPLFAARIKADGTVDTEFADRGFLDIQGDHDQGEPRESYAYHALLSDNEEKLALCGAHGRMNPSAAFAMLSQCGTDGKMDISFNKGKPVLQIIDQPDPFDTWVNLAAQPDSDGKLLVTGWDLSSDVLGRYDKTGKLDTTFAGGGGIGVLVGGKFHPSEGSLFIQPARALCAGSYSGRAAILAIKL